MNVTKALDQLKAQGYKYTSKRELILEIFYREGRYLNAKYVLEQMQKEHPQLSFDTVYRNLTLLSELGILEVTAMHGERYYRMACSGDDHHHHLICTECGKAKKIDICPMQGVFGEPEGFQITGHKFEIYGLCSDCGATHA
ncbi:Fur family transcriptional regulator [Numidum massiliense]|uniref:Fur family transcriptional regulator n=1 Tax=Numidum massiliense TaxID=1522315 RepID=UPI0006D5655E|nr:Fur family transcriptional regulator [Numidum massiliense]